MQLADLLSPVPWPSRGDREAEANASAALLYSSQHYIASASTHEDAVTRYRQQSQASESVWQRASDALDGMSERRRKQGSVEDQGKLHA